MHARLFVLLALASCVDNKDPIRGTQSFAVDLVSPALGGDIDHRLSVDDRTVTINLTALDADGHVDTGFNGPLQIYVQFLGTLTPELDATMPLDSVDMVAGKAMGKVVTLPPQVYGRATLWIDDGKNANATYATGASPALWYPDPTIQSIQRPFDETALDALVASPLQNKQVTVDTSRYGVNGRLIVTSVFSQGYTVSDAQCADEQARPPCVSQAYDHLVVFSFSAPTDSSGRLLQPGQIIDGFSGGVSEFNGLTEIGFPATRATNDEINPARIPAPAKLDKDQWFKPLSDGNGIINFERNEGGLIEIDNGAVCALDRDYETFKQWKLDPTGEGGDCSGRRNLINVITAGVVSEYGREQVAGLAGRKLTRVVGALRPVITSGGPIWIIFPRSAADLTLAPQ